jgi:hypothetical protein
MNGQREEGKEPTVSPPLGSKTPEPRAGPAAQGLWLVL